jgi:pimeloyl-ACP methyl ester carboxylesterase
MSSPPRPRRTPHPEKQVDLLGLRSRYIDVPASGTEEGPPLLLLHGHASRLEEYDALVPLIGKQRRVIVLDLPGCGEADKPADRAYTLSLYQDYALALLDHLKLDTLDLAGGSLGGNLTLRLGARQPERFRKLAAWAPAGAWQPMKRWQLLAQLMRRVPRLFWPAIWIQSRFWYSRDWAGRDQALEDAFRYYRHAWGPGFFRMYWDVGHDQASTSLFDVIHTIRQPVFLGWGDRDHALGMGHGVRQLKERIASSRLHVFLRASHSLANERVEELAEVVDRFLLEPQT